MTESNRSDPVEQIRRLYFAATSRSIHRDLARAIVLFKALSEDERDRAAVYMDGLSQMRSEWAGATDGTTIPPTARLGTRRPS